MLDKSAMEQFVNAKVELSVIIQNLTQIANKYLQSFDIKQDENINEDKVKQIEEVVVSAVVLLNSLREIFEDGEQDIKTEPDFWDDDTPLDDYGHAKLGVDEHSNGFEDNEEGDYNESRSNTPDTKPNVGDCLKSEANVKEEHPKPPGSSTENSPRKKKKLKVEAEELFCVYCPAKTFSSLASLKRHLKDAHDEELKLNCDVCHKEFADKYKLKAHKKQVHTVKKKGVKGRPKKDDKDVSARTMRRRLQDLRKLHMNNPEKDSRY